VVLEILAADSLLGCYVSVQRVTYVHFEGL